MKNSIFVTFSCSLTSGLLGVIISNWSFTEHEKRMVKLNLLQDIAGYRQGMIPGDNTTDKELYVALNKVFVVYNEHPKVIDEYRGFTTNMRMGQGQLANENFLNMINLMANINGLEYNQTHKEIFVQPVSAREVAHKLN